MVQMWIIMRDNVLWRKQASIIMLLANTLQIDSDRALDLYYSTQTAQQLADPAMGLQLMSDQYIVENILSEIQDRITGESHTQQ
jgi:hypothetical protein